MSEREYIEPSNKQLANFLVIYSQQISELRHLHLNSDMLERNLQDPVFREAVLKHHRWFVQQMNETFERMEKGELQCEYIRQNGKRCPNHNEPGDFYCGLHKEIDAENHIGTTVA